MLINKPRIIASLQAAIQAKGCIDFTVNCARWDTILNLEYGATKLHIAEAANAVGYETFAGANLVKLSYRLAV